MNIKTEDEVVLELPPRPAVDYRARDCTPLVVYREHNREIWWQILVMPSWYATIIENCESYQCQ